MNPRDNCLKTDLETRWLRHGRLISLLGVTSERLGDNRLSLTHTDPSLLDFDPRNPCPWLSDIGQVEYLIENHNQIVLHGHKNLVTRLLLVPTTPPVAGPLLYSYYAAVKAVVHLQLYEGVRLWVAFVRPKSKLGLAFSYSLEQIGKATRVWPSSDYYMDINVHNAVEAPKQLAVQIATEIRDAIAGALRVAAYRDEHFLPGERISLPSSWRRMLWLLSNGKCGWCHRAIAKLDCQIDHVRPIHPDVDQCRPTPLGNSNLFNLAALCGSCNRKKTNSTNWFPEALIPSLIPDPRVADYFRSSLVVAPRHGSHYLPAASERPGQFS